MKRAPSSRAPAFILDDLPWREGLNEVEVELVDAAGNRRREVVRFEVRTLPSPRGR